MDVYTDSVSVEVIKPFSGIFLRSRGKEKGTGDGIQP